MNESRVLVTLWLMFSFLREIKESIAIYGANKTHSALLVYIPPGGINEPMLILRQATWGHWWFVARPVLLTCKLVKIFI